MQEMECDGGQTFELLAQRLVIQTQEQMESAAALLKEIKQFQITIRSDQEKVVKAAHAAWKTARETMHAHLEVPERAEKVVKAKMAAFMEWQRKLEQEARQKAIAAAEELARKEREAAAAQALEDARLAEAERDEVTAAMALDEAIAIESAPIIPTVQPEKLIPYKVKGTSTRTVYDATVTNFAALPDDYKLADEKKLRKIVNAHKGECIIPGVKITQRTIVAQRTR